MADAPDPDPDPDPDPGAPTDERREDSDRSPKQPALRSFGRIKGRPLRPRQQARLNDLAPRLALPLADKAAMIDLAALFPDAQSVALEIGFGGGEHLIAQALARPTSAFIGVEPFENGVAKCLTGLADAGLVEADPGGAARPGSRIRIHQGDARDVVARLPAGCLDRIYLLFPDPWPKARHRKRRLLQPEFAEALALRLKAGGELRMATDWADYAAEALGHLLRVPGLDWRAQTPNDWLDAPSDHFATRYEAKRLGDCAPVWLRFTRI